MRENRPYGSEGGEAKSFPYPYQKATRPVLLARAPSPGAPAQLDGPESLRGCVASWIPAFVGMT